jgi:hypothetical protein
MRRCIAAFRTSPPAETAAARDSSPIARCTRTVDSLNPHAPEHRYSREVRFTALHSVMRARLKPYFARKKSIFMHFFLDFRREQPYI